MTVIMAKMKVIRTTIIEIPRLGEKIKKARENDNRSLTKICQLVGMTTSNWYRIEKEDTKALPEETLIKIEEVLGIDLGTDLANFKQPIAA